METSLGKIKSARFGHGGYQGAMIGVQFDLEFKGGGVGDFWGMWFGERHTSTQWTEVDRIQKLGEMVMRVNALLADAKVDSFDRLIGKPVEVTIDRGILKSWRILAEVL